MSARDNAEIAQGRKLKNIDRIKHQSHMEGKDQVWTVYPNDECPTILNNMDYLRSIKEDRELIGDTYFDFFKKGKFIGRRSLSEVKRYVWNYKKSGKKMIGDDYNLGYFITTKFARDGVIE